MNKKIFLNDILQMINLKNTKIRLLIYKSNDNTWNPIKLFKENNIKELLNGMYDKKENSKFKKGNRTIGLVRIESKNPDLWLLFHIGEITNILNISNGVGYEYKILTEYEKYFGRIIIRYHNKSQNLVREAKSLIDKCEVFKILENVFNDDTFPGYENVNISWEKLRRVVTKEQWQAALQNQKGIYLITDISNNKHYIGSATGKNMILGRWKQYAKNGHGENKKLKKLNFNYIKKNFRYSLLDIYKATTSDEIILTREIWWKEIFQSRKDKFGYNDN